ncbi:hypothetical protein [Mycobacteroides abscessus]|uniref:hypothetical protein n=1 Tax=Mycobacteroides abscessus TaxID=36809 RepID=UPI0012FFF544|nr:hypothetical protein [Mycobacteroides abscessus]
MNDHTGKAHPHKENTIVELRISPGGRRSLVPTCSVCSGPELDAAVDEWLGCAVRTLNERLEDRSGRKWPVWIADPQESNIGRAGGALVPLSKSLTAQELQEAAQAWSRHVAETLIERLDDRSGRKTPPWLPALGRAAGWLQNLTTQHVDADFVADLDEPPQVSLKELTAAQEQPETQTGLAWDKEHRDMTQVQIKGSNAELAAAAAQWWADRFSERLAPEPTGISVVDAVAALVDRTKPGSEQVEAFRQSLEAAINRQLETDGSSYIKMDYDPDRTLSEALEAAGIDARSGVNYLPWKTTTWIHDGEFTTL